MMLGKETNQMLRIILREQAKWICLNMVMPANQTHLAQTYPILHGNILLEPLKDEGGL